MIVGATLPVYFFFFFLSSSQPIQIAKAKAIATPIKAVIYIIPFWHILKCMSSVRHLTKHLNYVTDSTFVRVVNVLALLLGK